MKKIVALSTVFFLTPVFVLAQGTIGSVLLQIHAIIDTATPIIVALALLFFFWGLAKYILNAGDEEKKSEGRSIMIWGIIAIFVMLSVFGIVRVLQNTFDVDRSISPDVPSVGVFGDGVFDF